MVPQPPGTAFNFQKTQKNICPQNLPPKATSISSLLLCEPTSAPPRLQQAALLSFNHICTLVWLLVVMCQVKLYFHSLQGPLGA